MYNEKNTQHYSLLIALPQRWCLDGDIEHTTSEGLPQFLLSDFRSSVHMGSFLAAKEISVAGEENKLSQLAEANSTACTAEQM